MARPRRPSRPTPGHPPTRLQPARRGPHSLRARLWILKRGAWLIVSPECVADSECVADYESTTHSESLVARPIGPHMQRCSLDRNNQNNLNEEY